MTKIKIKMLIKAKIWELRNVENVHFFIACLMIIFTSRISFRYGTIFGRIKKDYNYIIDNKKSVKMNIIHSLYVFKNNAHIHFSL